MNLAYFVKSHWPGTAESIQRLYDLQVKDAEEQEGYKQFRDTLKDKFSNNTYTFSELERILFQTQAVSKLSRKATLDFIKTPEYGIHVKVLGKKGEEPEYQVWIPENNTTYKSAKPKKTKII